MNRQQIFDNFVTALDGVGKAWAVDPGCMYFPEGRPGCSIGCQPGFREKFEGRMPDEETIEHWLNPSKHDDHGELAKELKAFFGVENHEDVTFLEELQGFHDEREGCPRTWIGVNLNPESVTAFCSEWKLQVPSLRVDAGA